MQLARGTPGGSGTLCNLQGGPLVVQVPYATCKGDPWWFRDPMQLAYFAALDVTLLLLLLLLLSNIIKYMIK